MRPLDPRLRPHLAPARRPLAGVVLGGVLGGLLVIAQGFALGTLVVQVVTGQPWATAAWWTLALVAGRAVTSYAVEAWAVAAAGVVTVHLRRRVLDAALALDPLALSRRRRGELTLLATRGIAALEPYVSRYLPALVTACVLPPVTVAAIWWLDWLSGLIVVLTLPLVPGFAVLIGLATRARADRQWRALGALSGHFLDVVRGLPTLVAFRRAHAQSATIRRITDQYRRASLGTLRVAFASAAVLELVATISVALVAVSVGLRLANGSLDFRTALVVLLLAPEAYWPLRRLGAEFHAAAEGAAAWRAATDLLTEAPPPRIVSHQTRAETGLEPAFRGQRSAEAAREAGTGLRVEGLTLGYPGRGRPAVAGLTATFARPGLTAITGPSGCGKSTLLAALLGELPPQRGRVLVEGTDLHALDPDAWRCRVAWAPQRPWLTAGTVAENVRAGMPGATDAEVWGVLERVDLAGTVAALPERLHTPLGEDGAGLSAGERARLALARVLLADRPFVLLDEPSAHLDEATEAVILRVLGELATRSCVIAVAHRPAVAAAADHVVTLPPPPRLDESDPERRLGETRGNAGLGAGVRTRGAGLESGAPATSSPSGAPRFGLRTGTALGAFSAASGVALTATAAWLITRAAERPPVLYLVVAIVGVRAFGMARPALRYAERLVSHDAALRLLAESRARVYDLLVPLVPGRLGPRRGDLLTSVVDDVDSLVDDRLRVRQPMWTAGLVGAGTVAFAALLALGAGAVLAVVVGAAAAAAWLAGRGVALAEPELVRCRAAVSTRVEAIVTGARDLVLWQASGRALDALDREGESQASASLTSGRIQATARAVPLLGAGLGVMALAAALPHGTVSPAMTALLLMLPVALVDALTPAVDAAVLRVRTRAATARLSALETIAPAVHESPSPRALPAQHQGPPPTAPTLPSPVAPHPMAPPPIALASVTGGWGRTDAVTDLSLRVGPGSRLGLVGPSGSGKSTVAAYLLRFLDPRSGRVELAELDVRDLRLDDVRRTVGLVDDDPHVFGSTLVENVRLARPDATDAEVAAALDTAGLGSWRRSLPEGLHTWLGDGGSAVSGGERARIGIARALLADAPVLVLDEPTAHLDADTAARVADEVLGGDRRRSVLWITHGRIGLNAMDDVVDLSAQAAARGVSVGGNRAG